MFCVIAWSRVIRGRRPLAKEPGVDYEVMSDEDWEEEPEGEDLSVRSVMKSAKVCGSVRSLIPLPAES
jgi:hypothetical protein